MSESNDTTRHGLRGPARLLLAFGALMFAAGAASAQYRLDHWTTEQGLPQNTVNSIVQTRDGYLWFTTFDGLVRFDGVRFTVFNKTNSPGISSNRFTAVLEVEDGTLWIGTEDAGLVRYRDGVFTSFTSESGFPLHKVATFERDVEGRLLAVNGNDRCYVDDASFARAPTPYDDPEVRHYVAAAAGSFWEQRDDRIDRHGPGRVDRYRLPLPGQTGPITRRLEDSRGRLWCGTDTAIFVLDEGTVTRYPMPPGFAPKTLLTGLCEDGDGGILFNVSTDIRVCQGLIRFADGAFTVWGTDSELAGTQITSMLLDRERSVWIGTLRGLYRLRRQFISAYSVRQGLAKAEVYPVLQRENGDILVGTIQGLCRFDGRRFETIHVKWNDAYQPFVMALWEAKDRLWIGALGHLLWYENGRTRVVDELARENVYAVRSDREGRVWVGGEAGLYQFDGDRIQKRFTTRDGLPANSVRTIVEDRQGTLWVGTTGGLARREGDRFRAFTPADGLAGTHVRCVYEDEDGTLWIGTYDSGLSRFRDGRFVTVNSSHGLFNDGVFQILEDREGSFWISCNRGIYRVRRDALNDFADGRAAGVFCIAYDQQDGMLSVECNGGRQPAGTRLRDGTFCFPTQDGIVIVDPEAAAINQVAPPVLIESVSLEGAPVGFHQGVTIEPGQEDLEIGFTGLSFIKPEQVRFRYRLEGRDEDWTEIGPRRVVYYSLLPPGEYTFQVTAANRDGVWNTVWAAVKVTVVAPFWQRWWFLLLCVSAAGTAVFSAWKLRIRQLERRQAAQEAFSRQLIESIEAERKRMASDLHNGLGQNLLMIKNWAALGLQAKEEDEDTGESLSEISETVTIAIDEVRHMAQNLRPSHLERLGLTNTLEHMLGQIANSSDIEFTNEVEAVDGLLSPEGEIMLFRIVQECINNVLKHSGAEHAWVSVRRTPQGAEIVCRDDGKGFDPVQVAQSAGRGMGLAGLQERARILGGKLRLQSAPGEGTTVVVAVERAGMRHDG